MARKPGLQKTVRRPKSESGNASLPVAGVGASAGGLEAFTSFLKALPADVGMALVLIQHMDPVHDSMLPKLLAKAAAMPLHEVTDGMVVEPNHVYVGPPNVRMTISNRVLRLTTPPRGVAANRPIDYFFCALAKDLKRAGIGVILSGLASDGTQGLKAIKAEGGIAFAQDEESASYPGMPASAIAAGCIDFTLPPEKIAGELARMGRHPYVRTVQEVEPTRAIVILDGDLRIRRFTPMAENVLNLRPGDAGRPFAGPASTPDVKNWNELISGVVEHRRVVEQEVRDRTGHWYCLRMRPYRVGEQKTGGVPIALLDIDTVKRSLDEGREARDFAEAIVATVREPLLVLDAELRVLKATRSFCQTSLVSPAETEGQILFDLGTGQWNIPQLGEWLEKILPLNSRPGDLEVSLEFPSAGYRQMVLNARPIYRESPGRQMILLAMEDVTDRRRAEELARQRELVIETAPQAILSVGPDGRIAMANQRAESMFGYSREELLGQPPEMLLPERFREAGRELRGRRKDDTEFPLAISPSHIGTKEALRESEEHFGDHAGGREGRANHGGSSSGGGGSMKGANGFRCEAAPIRWRG